MRQGQLVHTLTGVTYHQLGTRACRKPFKITSAPLVDHHRFGFHNQFAS
ncbi:MAG: hypothetical protein HGA97_07610 [Chlorobiaceae bacterium]|nr:hypothetical protein [Chlorobiaceae bacterium]